MNTENIIRTTIAAGAIVALYATYAKLQESDSFHRGYIQGIKDGAKITKWIIEADDANKKRLKDTEDLAGVTNINTKKEQDNG